MSRHETQAGSVKTTYEITFEQLRREQVYEGIYQNRVGLGTESAIFEHQ
jgi:hypothetical protein